jgi:hypothetical protein
VPRPLRLGLIAVGLLAFLAISAGLARVLGANVTERGAVVSIVRAQARGDAAGVVRAIDGCGVRPACRAEMRDVVARVRGRGEVQVLRYDASTEFTVGRHTGDARIAWRAGNALPVVQCVRVRRAGGPISGFTVSVLRVSAPIDLEASC